MSVIVRNVDSQLLEVYVKGAPEMIYQYSVEKPKGYLEFIKKLSFSGFRTIAFSHKIIAEEELERLMDQDR